ncbi:MAG: DNA alkylation repair protein [Bdellovibrionales bacterium]
MKTITLSANSAHNLLKKYGSPERAKLAQRFFKTGPGQYGEGDVFIGVSVPIIRKISKLIVSDNSSLNLNAKNIMLNKNKLTNEHVPRFINFRPTVRSLLHSKYHENRLLALLILVEIFKNQNDLNCKKEIYLFYIKNIKQINNWDLVDTSAYNLVGNYLLMIKNKSVLFNLIKSTHHWSRRVAIISTLAFIRQGHTKLTFQLARIALNDKEDLMHKASGWMLREAGKKNPIGLLKFIEANGLKMPRTMLRYSIEKMSTSERKRILNVTK